MINKKTKSKLKIKLDPQIKTALSEYTKELKKIFGKHLEEVILFGSMAREEASNDSDIDIMVLSDLPLEKLRWSSPYWLETVDKAFEISDKYDFKILISPKVRSRSFTSRWSPLWANISREGVILWKKN